MQKKRKRPKSIEKQRTINGDHQMKVLVYIINKFVLFKLCLE